MKSKQLLKAELKHHKIWVEHSERCYGQGSPQNQEAREALLSVQQEIAADAQQATKRKHTK